MSLSSWLSGQLPTSAASVFTSFASPPMSARPMLRWWWPHGLVDPEEIKTEITQMYNAGFGGAEIEDVHHSIKVSLDPSGHGWGTQPWLDAVNAASSHAAGLDFQIDLAMGPAWPASVPTLLPDDPGASKEVVTGRVIVTGGTTYSGPVPAPYVAPKTSRVKVQKLIALQAWKMDNSSATNKVPVVLDLAAGYEDLKYQVSSNGTITWTPPDNNTWLLISYHMRGTDQKAEAGPHNDVDGAVIDHLSKAGVKTITDYFDKNIISPELNTLFREIGGSFFEDSVELEYSTLWTPSLRCDFRRRMGYDLFRYLPAIAQENQKNAFSFNDAEVTRGVINDFWTVMGQLYVENHADQMREWSKTHGMTYRAQTYGLPTDAMSAAGAVDIPEGESLGFKNLGDYRSLAGAANMRGKNLISNEAGAFAASAYTITWDLLLQTLNPILSTGNNHQVLHGFSYAEAPTALWPGFSAFSPYNGAIGYAESWGPRIPLWTHASDVMGYLSRVQYLLQQGQPKHDVAFFEQKGYVGAGYNSPWFADTGTMQGWSLNIMGPYELELPAATVRDKTFAPDGPAYKLLAFEGDSFASRAPVAKLSTAKKLLEFAKGGLPMLIVGDWSKVAAYGRGEYNQSTEITSIFSSILSLPNVVNVPTRDDIGAGVLKTGILPSVQYNAQLVSYQRADKDADHFFFVASHPATYAVSTKTVVKDVEADVLIPRRSSAGVPMMMDLWTGEATPIAQYEEVSDTQIRVHISLRAYQACMVTVAPLNKAVAHAVKTSATKIRRDDKGLWLRANTTGDYSSTLSTGKTVDTKIEAVPAAQELKAWTLNVQSWEPTADLTSVATVIVNHTLELSSLTPWTSIPELVDVSGIGSYNTTFDLGSEWPEDAGVVLSIPDFVGSHRVWVNEQYVGPVDQLATEFDVGKFVKKGVNTLRIEVATTLLNRLRIVQASVYGVAKGQAYGLVGPVVVKPYREVKIAE